MDNTTTYFGVKWEDSLGFLEPESLNETRWGRYHGDYYHLENSEFGKLFISTNVPEDIKESDFYKFHSLIYEHNLKNNKNKLVIIVQADEEVKIFKSKWYNGDFSIFTIDEFLSRFPASLAEKQQRALYMLYSRHKNYSDKIESIKEYMLFAKNTGELDFVLRSMINKGWLRKDTVNGKIVFYIDDNGWQEIDAILRYKKNKNVFIAMQFKDMDSVRDAIKSAITDAGFEPERIDEKEHIENIALKIQHDIKMCGLVVADLTHQNLGVYFEAGYAMALNIPVILCCKNEEINQIHFDICQYNTILYTSEEDLRRKLTERITAIMGLKEP